MIGTQKSQEIVQLISSLYSTTSFSLRNIAYQLRHLCVRHSEVSVFGKYLHFWFQFPANTQPGRQQEIVQMDGFLLSTWETAVSSRVPGFNSWTKTIAKNLGMNQRMEALSFLYLPNFQKMCGEKGAYLSPVAGNLPSQTSVFYCVSWLSRFLML